MGPNTCPPSRPVSGTGWKSAACKRSGTCAACAASARSVTRRPGSGPTTSPCWPATPTRSTPKPADRPSVRPPSSTLALLAARRGRGEMLMAIGRPHPTVSMRRFDRRRLRIPRPPPGDRILVWFRLPLLLLVAVTGYGVVGYRVLEGWGLLDALYMTVITLATVGFHEVQPLDAKGQVFTISLISAGVIVVSGPTLSDRAVRLPQFVHDDQQDQR